MTTHPPHKGSFEKAKHKQWIYGLHAVEAALLNPKRILYRLLVDQLDLQKAFPRAELVKDVSQFLQRGAVHQGIAAEVSFLEEGFIEDILHLDHSLVVVLDHVTDPHNMGAIIRSACAFGANAVISTKRHNASQSATLAKAASGALEKVPLISVSNLVNALKKLKAAGYWCYGLDPEGSLMHECEPAKKSALVLGAEGKGLRRLTQETVDYMLSIETSGEFRTLNVSNAAAIALYFFRKRT